MCIFQNKNTIYAKKTVKQFSCFIIVLPPFMKADEIFPKRLPVLQHYLTNNSRAT